MYCSVPWSTNFQIHCTSKTSAFYFWNNSVQNQQISIIFVTQRSDEICHKCLWNCPFPLHLKNVTALPCEIQKVIIDNKSPWAFAAAVGQVLRVWNWYYSFTDVKTWSLCVLWLTILRSFCHSSHFALPVNTSLSRRPQCQHPCTQTTDSNRAKELKMPPADQIQRLDPGQRADKDHSTRPTTF